MENYELTLTENYVSDWNFYDAIRELIQNGTDQEILQPKNEFYLDYDFSSRVLSFTNEAAALKPETLLLGESSKSEDESTVGKFGEGYKIAALVLNRIGKTFTIYNNGKNEIWRSQFSMSKKWNQKILSFTIDKNITDDNDLIIEVGNVSHEEFMKIREIWLYMDGKDYYSKIETEYGEILTDEEMSGLVFVNGLSVNILSDMSFGYNFNSKYVTLERDRKTCRDWEIEDLTAKMICQAVLDGRLDLDKMTKLADLNVPDISHIRWQSYEPNTEKIAALLIEQFDKKHPDSIPVESQEEYNRVKTYGGHPVIVPSLVATVLKNETKKRTHNLTMAENFCKDLTIKQQLEKWLHAYFECLTGEAIEEFRSIINKLE